jgi:hypothetical protein
MGEHQSKSLEIVSRRTMVRLGSGAFGVLVAYTIAGLALLMSWPAAAQFCDSTFPATAWALKVFSCPAGNTVSATPATTSGSAITPATACPLNGNYRDVTNSLPMPGNNIGGSCPGESTVYGVHTFIGQSYVPAKSGGIDSIGFQIDYECPDSVASAPCSGSGQAFGPTLFQNNRYFVANAAGKVTSVTGTPPGWKRFSTSSPLGAADFNEITTIGSGATAVIKIDATSHPDFSAKAQPIQCGFYTGNATYSAGYTTRAGYDNWVCTINPGILKVCKVAGPGIAAGTSFSFTANGNPFQVAAGPAPGGTCVVVGPGFPVGTTVNVAEILPTNVAVSNIAVSPQANSVSANPTAGTASVKIGSGVTEVTYTDINNKRGYLEICKTGAAGGSFKVNPGNLGPFVVAAGACSPAIQVDPGTVAIQEVSTSSSSTAMSGCTIIPSSRSGSCNLTTQTATATVVLGDVSTQTIVTFNNAPIIIKPNNTNPIQ